jgi:hypothetical protein
MQRLAPHYAVWAADNHPLTIFLAIPEQIAATFHTGAQAFFRRFHREHGGRNRSGRRSTTGIL